MVVLFIADGLCYDKMTSSQRGSRRDSDLLWETQVNEFIKKMTTSLTTFWKNASIVKKGILAAVILAIVVAIVMTCQMSSKPSGERVLNARVTDENARNAITTRLDKENMRVSVTDDGYILVDDKKTAEKARAIILSEDLAPSGANVFASFYDRKWNGTDMEQTVKRDKAIQEEVKNLIQAFDDINKADVVIVQPDKTIFEDNKDPVTASVLLDVASNSEVATSKKRIKGIESIILTAVKGLKHENLTISDSEGNVLNDFEGQEEADRVSITNKQQKTREEMEARMRAKFLKSIKGVMKDRVNDINIHIDFDMSKKSIDRTEYLPFKVKQDNPATPYDDSETKDSVPISSQESSEVWQGTGYNPEGPAGVEGQTPPVYSDMSNVVGKSTKQIITKNNAVGSEHTLIPDVAPEPGKTTMSFNVDGQWTIARDIKGNYLRKTQEELAKEIEDANNGNISPTMGLNLKWYYVPATKEEQEGLVKLAQGAIGYNAVRGDIINVTSIPTNRLDENKKFEEEYNRSEQNKRTLILVLVVVAASLVGFVAFRMISKEMERKRRAKEEELLRQQQAEREKALWEAQENTNNTVTMSVEDTRRQELQETAINLAKEHPEDVAMLIRTWLMEE